MAAVVGDSLYFDADGSTHGRELWAHNHANQTTWMVKIWKRATTTINCVIQRKFLVAVGRPCRGYVLPATVIYGW